MTNEQLAEFIKDGESDDLIPILWGRVRKLLHSMSDNEYRRRPDQFDRCGVTAWDLKQVCYTEVFIKSLEKFDPDKNLKLVTYFKYPFMRAVDKLLGTTNGRPNTKPLDNCVSLDAPVNTSDIGEPLTLADVIPDIEHEPAEEQIKRKDMKRIVRQAVAQLDEPYRQIVQLHYFSGMSYKGIGEKLGVSGARVGQLMIKAIKRLRRNPELKMLNYAHEFDSMGRRIVVHRFDHDEFYPGFIDSPEADEARALLENTPALSYGLEHAIRYEAYYQFWRRKHREREEARAFKRRNSQKPFDVYAAISFNKEYQHEFKTTEIC